MLYQKTLTNGIRVVAEKNDNLRSVTVGFWVRTGQRNELAGEEGISHFIEHMLFKGTEKRSARRISAEIDEIGGQINAFTAKEYTCFYTRSMDTDLPIVLDVLSDMLQHSLLDEKELAKEQGVVIEEINMVDDTPEDLVHDLLAEATFGTHPLAKPILGTKQSVSAITPAAIRRYMDRQYVPDNIVIALAGHFEIDRVTALLEELLADWPYRGASAAPEKAPEAFLSGQVTRIKKTEQLHICLGYGGVSDDDPLLYPMMIFNNLFGGGMSSRLFQEIREERGLAYSVYSYPSQYRDTGTFTIYGGMTLQQCGAVAEIVRSEIKDVLSGGISVEELERSRSQMRGNYILSNESGSNRMMAIGRSYLMLGRVRTPEQVLEKINAVTMDDVMTLAERVFAMPPAISVIGPKKGVEEAIKAFD